MRRSAALALAEANRRFKSGGKCSQLEQELTPAQSGTALWLSQNGGLDLAGEAERAVKQSERILRNYSHAQLNSKGSFTRRLLELEAGTWFDPAKSNRATEVAAGFWLAGVFNRGLSSEEVVELTEFLRAETIYKKKSDILSVRRYPTGGISEKQALILPPLLMSLAKDISWCSPFLVARKLAHTGGTRDKLSVVPGFSVTDISSYQAWDYEHVPVRYFSADKGFCLRDAEMYRLRGETGTVAEMVLMAASIMSKQTALPADSVIIDVLYGRTAFLNSLEEAATFGELCQEVGCTADLRVTPMSRKADSFLGNSIGASTEVVEAAEMLIAGKASSELATAKRFICQFATELGLNENKVLHLLEQSLSSGAAFRSMLSLWSAHGASSGFLANVERDPRATFLSTLSCEEIRVESAGELRWNSVLTADIVNEKINRPEKQTPNESGNSRAIAKGGLEILVKEKAFVSPGDVIARIYCEKPMSASVFEGAYEVN